MKAGSTPENRKGHLDLLDSSWYKELSECCAVYWEEVEFPNRKHCLDLICHSTCILAYGTGVSSTMGMRVVELEELVPIGEKIKSTWGSKGERGYLKDCLSSSQLKKCITYYQLPISNKNI